MRAAVTGEDVPEVPAEAALPSVDAIHQELSRFRYCTVFVVEGDGLDKDALERELEQIGDSLLVVGDRTAARDQRDTRDRLQQRTRLHAHQIGAQRKDRPLRELFAETRPQLAAAHGCFNRTLQLLDIR